MATDQGEVVVYGKPTGVTFNVGDEFDSISGVISYHFNTYKVFVRGTEDLEKKTEPIVNYVDIKDSKTMALDGTVKNTFTSGDVVYVDVTTENITEVTTNGDLLINVMSEIAGVKTMKKFSMFPAVQLKKRLKSVI